jgi:hypothetical protein
MNSLREKKALLKKHTDLETENLKDYKSQNNKI